MHKKLLAVLSTVLFSTLAVAQSPSLSELERVQKLDAVIQAANQAQLSLDNLVASRKVAAYEPSDTNPFVHVLRRTCP